MRGRDQSSGNLFSYVDLEERVPDDHPLRLIREIVNDVLGSLSSEFETLYSHMGRPSIPPEKLLRALLLQAFYSIRSERQLMEQLNFNMLFRWFVGLGLDDGVWDASAFCHNRDRLLEAEVSAQLLAGVIQHHKVRGLLSRDHFSVDGTLIEAWASMKSFRPKGEDDGDGGSGRNAERDFHGEKRSNATHASATDPDARLYRKGNGRESKLCYMGHALTENRHGLAVGGGVTIASGTAEREAALDLIDRHRLVESRGGRRRITVGGDKGFDVADFVEELRHRKVTPHIAVQDHVTKTGKRRKTKIDGRTTRHPGYGVSQRCRKRIEEVFGWVKTSAGLSKTKFRGRHRVDASFTLALAAYNLVRLRACLLLIVPMMIAGCGVAEAHTNERAFILLLPTHLYIVGGALAVALSFVMMTNIPTAGLRALERARWGFGRWGFGRWRLGSSLGWAGEAPSLAVFTVALALVIAGHAGSRDPLANPLPLVVWTLWWVGLTLLHALFGNLWARLNPWRGPYRMVTLLPGLSNWRARPPLGYPAWLGYWPAFGLFFGFAWFELVHPAPHDPAVLANAVAVYAGVTFAGMLLFGGETWLRRGEAFSLFFRIVAWLSPLGREPDGSDGGEAVTVAPPGIRLLDVGALPLGVVAFVLSVLATVSFDGLSRSFWWLGLIGENPLQFAGRTALVAVNSFGLVAMFGALAAVSLATVLLGRALAGSRIGVGESLGRMIVSIVPIAFGYHVAHYLPAFLVDVQYAARALSDPYALGWNLIGARDMHVTASFLTDHRSVEVIWNVQVGIIVAAHVMAVAIAHLVALRDGDGPRQTMLGQAPTTVLMIGYTLFGLWLLATPAVG